MVDLERLKNILRELNRQVEWNQLNIGLKNYFLKIGIDINLINSVMLSLSDKDKFEFSFLIRNLDDGLDVYSIDFDKMNSILK